MQSKKAGVAITMALILTTAGLLRAADTASTTDRDFVAKVSQGGQYEVEAGRIAATRGHAAVVRNFGVLEAHDHEGVGAGLKAIAGKTGIAIQPGLNPEFSARLAKLKAVPADQFDAYYINDMKQIHNKDEGLFVQESKDGTEPYRGFTHEVAVLVKAHLGWLNTL